MVFKEFAEDCRRQANEFVGRPEAPFLLKVAKAFDELDSRPRMGSPVMTGSSASFQVSTIQRA